MNALKYNRSIDEIYAEWVQIVFQAAKNVFSILCENICARQFLVEKGMREEGVSTTPKSTCLSEEKGHEKLY